MYNTDFFSHVAFAGRCFIEEIPRYRTEDLGYLLRRYPNETFFKNGNDPVSFYNNTISLSLEEIPSNSEISLHYLIAWNTLPEKISPSTWFSVDIDQNFN